MSQLKPRRASIGTQTRGMGALPGHRRFLQNVVENGPGPGPLSQPYRPAAEHPVGDDVGDHPLTSSGMTKSRPSTTACACTARYKVRRRAC